MMLKKPCVEVKDEKILFKIIKIAFMQRRKTLLNALSNGNIGGKKQIEEMLLNLQLDLNIRGERLSLENFGKIADYIYENKL